MFSSSMKTLSFLSTILLISFVNIHAQNKQEDKLINAIALTTCDCIKEQDINLVKNSTDAENIISNCFMVYKDNVSKIMELTKIRKIKFSDGEKMSELGEEIALRLIKNNCNEYIQLSLKMVKSGLPESDDNSKVNQMSSEPAIIDSVAYIAPETGVDEEYRTIEGKLVRVDATGELAKVIIKDDNNRLHTFYWLESFDNEDFLMKPAYYKIQHLAINFYEASIYFPQKKRYIKVKVLKGVSATD